MARDILPTPVLEGRDVVEFYNKLANFGNVSDVLLKFQQLANQYNKKELPYYFLLYTIEISVF